jgi:hypothetical protein
MGVTAAPPGRELGRGLTVVFADPPSATHAWSAASRAGRSFFLGFDMSLPGGHALYPRAGASFETANSRIFAIRGFAAKGNKKERKE